jgi:RHS repeat-associated protein
MLSKIEVDRGTGTYQGVIDDATFNARGQVTAYTHDNGVETTLTYDSDIEHLVRIFTRITSPSTVHFQDLNYDYDPVGNPVRITDDLAISTYRANQIIPNYRTFSYDPRYRLIRATGKRHSSASERTPDILVPSPSVNDYEPYSFRYSYDAVGNFTTNQEYKNGTNNLFYKAGRIDLFNGDATEAGSFTDPTTGNWRYDDNGNTLHTSSINALAYTFDNQVRFVDLLGGGAVRYLRHGDQRVLRFLNKTGAIALGVYLGPWEYHQRQGTVAYTKVVLHVDGYGRHAQAEKVLSGSDSYSLPIFFHHSDHLKSGHVLTKSDGTLLSQEEYFPYGRPSDRRDARNRYRFIGVERDEDTNLCMTGPRTYDPVCGRFLQGDPIAGMSRASTPFQYCSSSPTRNRDATGYQEVPTGPIYYYDANSIDIIVEPPATSPPAPIDSGSPVIASPEPGIETTGFVFNELLDPISDVLWYGMTHCKPLFGAAVLSIAVSHSPNWVQGVMASIGDLATVRGTYVLGRTAWGPTAADSLTPTPPDAPVVREPVPEAVSSPTAIDPEAMGQKALATTKHGAERVEGPGATRGGVLSEERIAEVRANGVKMTQTDGATVRILQTESGTYDVFIYGERGTITTFKHIPQSRLNRLARNYGWH